MTENEVAALAATVLWAAFAVSIALGFIAQRTHFCTMGAVGDIVNMGDWTRMRMWVLAMGVAILGFNAMVALGWVRAADTLYGASRLLWLSHAVGGLLFGIGMVLASGCGNKTLVRIGGGSLKSLVVFGVLGLSAWATLRGLTAVWRHETVDAVAIALPASQDLPSLLGAATGQAARTWAAVLGAAAGLGLIAWVLARPEGRQPSTWLGGVGVGLCVVVLWWVSGRLGYVPEDPTTLEPRFLGSASGRMESFSFVAPVAQSLEYLVFFSDASRGLTLGIVAVVGVVLGSAIEALRCGRFRWEGFRNAEDTANHLVGGALMGIGGVTAIGCTVGQGLSGVSTLSIGSLITLAFLLLGAVLALRWQAWRIERMA